MPTVLGVQITNPAWCDAIARQMRAAQKREQAGEPRPKEKDDSADWLKWCGAMRELPGIFVPCELMPNWLNGSKVPMRLSQGIKKAQRRSAYEKAVEWCAASEVKPPYLVTITRYGPSRMDDDGNAAALKYVRDGIARGLGIDDGDEARIRFEPTYEHAKFYGYRVVIEESRRAPAAGR